MFEFEYKGEVIKFQGYNLSQALDDANKMFGSLPEGVWMQSEYEPHKYRWVEGNFFD